MNNSFAHITLQMQGRMCVEVRFGRTHGGGNAAGRSATVTAESSSLWQRRAALWQCTVRLMVDSLKVDFCRRVCYS
jgi:hypothetical protein